MKDKNTDKNKQFIASINYELGYNSIQLKLYRDA